MELKNLIRQNFIKDDVGRNKAEVLSERYNELYDNITVSFVPKYVTYKTFDEKYLPNNEYSDEHFVCLSRLKINKNDILINLVDNEGFKKKLDFYINRHKNQTFAAGVNLFNGQAWYSNSKKTNGYVWDHSDLLELFDEVSVHACADADANGTDDNPEQLFNGNDVAASVLANLYQVVLTDIPLYKKISFTTGMSMSCNIGNRNYALLYQYASKVYRESLSEIVRATNYFKMFGELESVVNLRTSASKRWDKVRRENSNLINFINYYEEKQPKAVTTTEVVKEAEVVCEETVEVEPVTETT